VVAPGMSQQVRPGSSTIAPAGHASAALTHELVPAVHRHGGTGTVGAVP
jgi:hypothetical protein